MARTISGLLCINAKKIAGEPTNRASFGFAPAASKRLTSAVSLRSTAAKSGVGGVKSGI
jgi:hypothetical protein